MDIIEHVNTGGDTDDEYAQHEQQSHVPPHSPIQNPPHTLFHLMHIFHLHTPYIISLTLLQVHLRGRQVHLQSNKAPSIMIIMPLEMRSPICAKR